MKRQKVNKLVLLCFALTWSLSAVAHGLRTWKNETREYYVSPDPSWIPVLSWIVGPLIPIPEFQPIIVHGYKDTFFSKPAEDWRAYQPMFQGGFSNGVHALLFHEIYEVIADIEHWVRDIFEFILTIGKFTYCIAMSLTGTDISIVEKPQPTYGSRWTVFREKRAGRMPEIFLSSSKEEWQLVRCLKIGADTLLDLLYQVPKFLWYWWNPTFLNPLVIAGDILSAGIMLAGGGGVVWGGVTKWHFRAVISGVKFVFTLMHTMLSTRILSFDAEYCWMIHPLLGSLCSAMMKSFMELIFDASDCFTEDLFCEVICIIRCVVWDNDNRITNAELEVFSNVTYKKAAASMDKVRFDGTARIDDYYRDYASKIQANELFERHDDERTKEIVYMAKEEFCSAVWLPPMNTMARLEYKSEWLARVIKNDHELDIGEFRCLCIQYSQNLAYNTDPRKNCDQEIIRVLERFDDVVNTFPRLNLTGLNERNQDKFLDGLDQFIHNMETVARQVPSKRVHEELELIGIQLAVIVNAMAEHGCPGTKERRERAVNEMGIFADMVRAKGKMPLPKLEC